MTYPYFTRYECSFYCVLGDYNCISVYNPVVKIAYQFPPNQAINGTPITQSEFEAAYVKASDFLSEKFESMRELKLVK